ncbi:type I restriction-modification system [Vibrio ishigakensis]|uniref:Type I restriction-modification system n=1 Tax=Vibrio ishigakensis TaxID=1481914 RepID=A0A0B8QMJ4_9VIBR|nr:type I restriction-modification system [Vibrio ishigakensis]
MHYFVGESGAKSTNEDERSEKEALRLTLYQAVAKLIRSYTNLANEMEQAGYTAKEAQSIKQEVAYFEKVRDEVKLSSGDLLEMKRFEPAMRQLLDMYIRADDSETLMDFEEFGLIDLVVNNDGKGLDSLPKDIRKNEEAMAEAIENNVRKTIVDENPVNPKYFESMATLLDELIKQRREQVISYQEYLEQIRALAKKVVNPTSNSAHNYPDSVDTFAKQALYDNFGNDEVLTTQVDTAVRLNKEADWLGDTFKERKIENAILEATNDFGMDDDDAIDEQLDRMMDIIKAQREYH